jgi:4-amino-4-deoxy-L-arabinose transferase-like glycosyltransferase
MIKKVSMFSNIKQKLILILLLAFLLRFVGLEKFSPPLNRDEVAIGYNAYSLLETGKDEHGMSWPLSFKSIGDYKMPGYIYLSMLPIKLFGLSVSTTRFWSAFAGFIAVLIIYSLTYKLSVKMKFNKLKSDNLALFSAFILAINPWHIHYSRIAFEANVNLTLFLLALLLYIKSFKKPFLLIFSAITFVAMQFMYSSTFIFLPLFLPILILLTFKDLKKIKALVLIISLVVLSIGSFLSFKSVLLVSQAKTEITVFSDPTTIDYFNNIRSFWNQKNPFIAKFYYNKAFYLGRIILVNYLKNFSPGFLFLNQVNHPWHFIPGQGFFYLIDGPLMIYGLICLIRKKKNKYALLLLTYLLLSPLPSAITIDAPHATRSLYLIPILCMIIALGIVHNQNPRLKNLKKVMLFIYSFFFIILLRQYFYVFPKKFDPSLYPGIKSVIAYIQELPEDIDIYFTDVSSSPYIYLLFYDQVDPLEVQQNAIWKAPDNIGLTNVEKFKKYHFIDDLPNSKNLHYLVLDNQKNSPAGYNLEKSFSNQLFPLSWQIYRNF